MIVAAVRQLLLADSVLAAAIGTRVHPNELPQKPTAPAVVVSTVSSVPGNTMDGSDGLVQSRIELAIWSATHAQAVTLADRVRVVLAGKGPQTVAWVASPAGSVVIDSFDFSLGEEDVFSDELELHGRRVEFYVWHQQPFALDQDT